MMTSVRSSTHGSAASRWWRASATVLASLLVPIGLMVFTLDSWKRGLLGAVLALAGIVLVLTLHRRPAPDPDAKAVKSIVLAVFLFAANDIGHHFLDRGLWPVAVAAVVCETAVLSWVLLR